MKKTKLILYTFILIIIISSLFIGVGLYLNNISKPKYIFSKGIDVFKEKINNYNKTSKDLNLKDKYSINGTIEYDLDSEYYKSGKEYNLINNLNNMNTSFKIQKNQSKNMGYMEINGSIKDDEILNAKYYIADSTKYYYINDIVDNYINAGACNYFENINTSTTERENIDYLYNFVINSVKNNLKDEYFTDIEEKDSYVATLKIDDNNLKEILENVLKDLKKDTRSKKILDNIDKNILKTKIKDNERYIPKDEYYKISIYTTKILHKPLKYKVEYMGINNTSSYIYEGNENKGNLYYIDNDINKYNISLEFKKDEIQAKIKDSSDKEIGEFKLEKNNYDTTINYTFEENNEKIDLIYSSKFSKVKKNESFTNKKNLSFKYVVDKETRLNGEININLEVKNKFGILADVSEAKLQSNLKEEEKEKLNNLYEDIENRLER